MKSMLPIFLLFVTGCQSTELDTSTLNHPSFDTLDHFTSFLQSLDFQSLREYQREEKKTKVEKNQKRTVLAKSTEGARADCNESTEYSMLYWLSEENGTKKESYENHHHYFYHNEKTFFSLSRANQQAPNEILHDFENGIINYSKVISDDSKLLNSPRYISRKEADTILEGVLTPSRYPDYVASYQSAYSIKNEAKVSRYSSRMDADRYLVDIDYYSENIMTSYHAKYLFDSNFFLVSCTEDSYAAVDGKKDWNNKKHQAKENYILTETSYRFDFEAKKTVDIPSEKEAILSIFGPDALD